eukprot:535143-Rhodomonas_salina.1
MPLGRNPLPSCACAASGSDIVQTATRKGHIENFYAGKSVLMIGASGFVGRILYDSCRAFAM